MEKGINKYTCEVCGQSIVTNNPNSLTTPAFIRCRATIGCGGTMESDWYRVPQTLTPDHEWYKPDSFKGLSPGLIDHVRRGGGVLRKIEQ